MHWMKTAVEIRARLARDHGASDVDVLLKRLPGAMHRMGLVRTLEWLQVGKKVRNDDTTKRAKPLGPRLMEEIAPFLRLDTEVDPAVRRLESCDRRALFHVHRDAVRLFEALAAASRLESR